mgnify:CR=1 FL=1
MLMNLAYPDNLIRETEGLTVAIRSLLTDAQHKQLPQTAAEHAYKVDIFAIFIWLFESRETTRHETLGNSVDKEGLSSSTPYPSSILFRLCLVYRGLAVSRFPNSLKELY